MNIRKALTRINNYFEFNGVFGAIGDYWDKEEWKMANMIVTKYIKTHTFDEIESNLERIIVKGELMGDRYRPNFKDNVMMKIKQLQELEQ